MAREINLAEMKLMFSSFILKMFSGVSKSQCSLSNIPQWAIYRKKKISLSSLNGSNFLLLLFFSVVVKIQKSKKRKNELFEETLLCIVLTLKIGIFIEAAATCSRFIFLRGGFRVWPNSHLIYLKNIVFRLQPLIFFIMVFQAWPFI